MVYLHWHEDFLDRELARWTENAATIAPGDSLDLDTCEEGDGLRAVCLIYCWGRLSEGRHGMVSPFTDVSITLFYVSYHMPLVVPSERRNARRRIVRLCVIGDSPDVRPCAVALVEQGHEVYWLTSTETLRTLHHGAEPLTVATDLLPATCQYVIPVQAYHYEGIRLVCVNQECWQHSDLHTRLFTYLCLLQRALVCAVFHTWGPWPIAYVTIYTARFLEVPAVLSYSLPLMSATLEQPFLWGWVARQVAAAIVSSPAEQERLLTLAPLTARQVHVIDPTQSHLGHRLTGLYARLRAAL